MIDMLTLCLKLEDSTLREKGPQETDATKQSFLSLRPDGPGKKSRANSRTLAEGPQSDCAGSRCIDLCETMYTARVFSSLLYQDVSILPTSYGPTHTIDK